MSKLRRKIEDENLINEEKITKLSDKIYSLFQKEKVTLDEFSQVNRKVKKLVKNNVRIL